MDTMMYDIYLALFLLTAASVKSANWGEFEVKDCSSDCIREKSAILWDLQGGINYKNVCETTSAQVDQYYFKRPSNCEYRLDSHIYGIFSVPDITCCSVNTKEWMKFLPSEKKFSQLTIPGTHDSAASNVIDIARTQDKSLAEQLDLGVRYFDIRCRHINDMFTIHHGPFYLNMNFDNVQNTFQNFLISHPTEFILVSIKQEHTDENNRKTFADVFQSYAEKLKDYWYLNATFPKVGDVRGKMVLIRRFGGLQKGIYANPSDNSKFHQIPNQVPHIYIQDYYYAELGWSQRFIDQKDKALRYVFDQATNDDSESWYLNFINVGFNGVIPYRYASTLNPSIRDYLIKYARDSTLFQKISGRLGTIILDFPENTPDLIRNIISMNMFDLRSAEVRPQVRHKQYFQTRMQYDSSVPCFDDCMKDLNCAAITVQPTNGNCYLSRWDQLSSAEMDINFISFFKQPPNSEIRLKDRNSNHYQRYTVYSATHCYKKCEDDNDCAAITYISKSDGADCYLYKYPAIGSSGSDPDSMSIYKGFAGAYIRFGVRNFNPYATYRTTSAVACYKICIEDNQCATISYENKNEGAQSCYLYDWYGNYTSAGLHNSWISIFRPFAEIRKGIRIQNHFRVLNVYSGAECLNKCYQEPTCLGTTYEHARTAPFPCYLYDSIEEISEDTNCSSHFKPPINSKVKRGIRLSNDYASGYYNSALDCFNTCRTNTTCKAITFDSRVTGKIRCYFYNNIYQENIDHGWISYLKS